jgi:hypothetical protein
MDVSQYPTSKYAAEPQQSKQHGTGTKIDMKTTGRE